MNSSDGVVPWRIPEPLGIRILDHLCFLYGAEQAASVWEQLERILHDFRRRNPDAATGTGGEQLAERDAILITYGDQFQEPAIPPLQTLHQVLTGILGRVVSGVHILPFYPYSSDDGFSITDYR